MYKLIKGCIIVILFCLSASFTGCASGEEQDGLEFPGRDNFDRIIYCGEGFWFVRKTIETYYMRERQYGIVNARGEFVSELSAERFRAVSRYVRYPFGGYRILIYNVLDIGILYIGENMFIFYAHHGQSALSGSIFHLNMLPDRSGSVLDPDIDSRINFTIFNADTDEFIHSGHRDNITIRSPFRNDYTIISINRNVYRIYSDGTLYDLEIYSGRNNIGPLNEGVFFARNSFFNTNGELVLDLSRYHIVGRIPCVIDGRIYFEFLNPAGTRFHVEYDIEGNRLYEPEMVES